MCHAASPMHYDMRCLGACVVLPHALLHCPCLIATPLWTVAPCLHPVGCKRRYADTATSRLFYRSVNVHATQIQVAAYK